MFKYKAIHIYGTKSNGSTPANDVKLGRTPVDMVANPLRGHPEAIRDFGDGKKTLHAGGTLPVSCFGMASVPNGLVAEICKWNVIFRALIAGVCDA